MTTPMEYAGRFREWARLMRETTAQHQTGLLLNASQGRDSDPGEWSHCAWGLAAEAMGLKKAFAKEEPGSPWLPGYRHESGDGASRHAPDEVSRLFLPPGPEGDAVRSAAEEAFSKERIHELLETAETDTGHIETLICLISDRGPQTWPDLAEMLEETAQKLEDMERESR